MNLNPGIPLSLACFIGQALLKNGLNIIDWCKENENPQPTWEVRAESVVTTFLPSTFFVTGKKPGELDQQRPELRPESRPESLEEEVLNLLQTSSLSKAEISQALRHKHISGGLKKALVSLLDRRKITYTLPEKPNSRFQKYKLDAKEPKDYSSEETRPESRPESRPELRPESLEEEILHLLKKEPLSKGEISQALKHKHISGALKKTLISLLNRSRIAFTVPEKPNSRLQKYKLNE